VGDGCGLDFSTGKGEGRNFFTAKTRRTRRGWGGFCGGLRGGGWVFVRGSGAGAGARGLPGKTNDAVGFWGLVVEGFGRGLVLTGMGEVAVRGVNNRCGWGLGFCQG